MASRYTYLFSISCSIQLSSGCCRVEPDELVAIPVCDVIPAAAVPNLGGNKHSNNWNIDKVVVISREDHVPFNSPATITRPSLMSLPNSRPDPPLLNLNLVPANVNLYAGDCSDDVSSGREDDLIREEYPDSAPSD